MKRKKIMETTPKGTGKEGRIFTAQTAGGILILNFYEDRKLKVRYCMDTETNEYLSCLDGGLWKQQMIKNVWEHSYYNSCTDAECEPDSEADTGLARDALGIMAGNIFNVIANREYSRNTELRGNRADNKRMRIWKLMEKVGRLPDDFDEWICRMSGIGDYAFPGASENEMVCSSCKGSFPRKRKNGKKVVHNETVECPCCKKELEAKTRTKQVSRIVHALVLQEVDEKQNVARHFTATVRADSRGIHICRAENVRIMLRRQPSKRACDIYYSTYHVNSYLYHPEWETTNPCNRRMYSEFLYPSGIQESLKDTAYEPLVNAFTALAAAGMNIKYNNLMAAYHTGAMPSVMEYLCKGRFFRLASETADSIFPQSGSYYGPLDLYGQEDADGIFGISDRQKINRIRDRNGGEEMLEWMRLSDRYGVKISDETLEWLTSSRIRTKDISFIAGQMSPQQVMNYVKKQKETEYPALDEKQILSEWKDYLQMCMKAGKDTMDEMVYRPRQLKRRHDELVMEINRIRILNDMERDAEGRRKAARELSSKFPGAEKALREAAKKFTYENGQFRIIVPETLFDIVTEGQALHHCVGSADRYFDRIMQHETYICFLRRASDPETPFYTIEVEPGGTIRQHRSYLDEEPGIEEIRGFLREWQQAVKKRMDEKDREHADVSRKKREENLEELKRQNNIRVLQGLQEDFMDAM